MPVTIELSPDEEALLRSAARSDGIAMEECARRLIAQHLPSLRNARIERVRAFLSERVVTGRISPEVARTADDALTALDAAIGPPLAVPKASTGPDGQVLLTWDEAEHHFELEIPPDEPAVFFYRNRRTGETWDADYSVGGPIPEEAGARLRLITQ